MAMYFGKDRFLNHILERGVRVGRASRRVLCGSMAS